MTKVEQIRARLAAVMQRGCGCAPDPDACCALHDSRNQDCAYLLRLVEAGQRLNETLHWLAQTVHQNHHDHDDGLFDTCRKNTCQAATKALTVYAAVREEQT